MERMLPSLYLDIPTSVFPDSDKAWHDRVELVQGGCKSEGSTEQINCYDTWSTTIMSKVLETPSANTIVFVSVGAGVLELQAIQLVMGVREYSGGAKIRRIWLIDPELDADTSHQVSSKFLANIDDSDVEVKYFSGREAYTNASNEHNRLSDIGEHVEVAVVGGLNISFGMVSDHPIIVSRMEKEFTFFKQLEDDNRSEGSLSLVQAYHNDREGFINRIETVEEFAKRRRGIVTQLRNMRFHYS